MNVTRTADSVTKYAESLDYSVDSHRAQTGSIYLTLDHVRLGCEVVIRVSDHADAYATSAYSCDGFEGTLAGAKAFICNAIRTTEAARARLVRARRRSARLERFAEAAVWVRGYAAQRGMSIAEACDVCPLVPAASRNTLRKTLGCAS